MPLKILSRNVAGLNNSARLHQAINMARAYDITLFQESKLDTNQAPFLRAKWGGGQDHVFISSPGGARRGTITLFHPRTSPTHLYGFADPEGQFMINVCKIKDEYYVIINTCDPLNNVFHSQSTSACPSKLPNSAHSDGRGFQLRVTTQ